MHYKWILAVKFYKNKGANMEKNKDRILAYSLAKVIELSDMSEVAGGSTMSHRETLRPSGPAGWDAHIDVVIDF